MNNNQTTQQSKSDPKGKAIASFLLGIIGIIIILGLIYETLEGWTIDFFSMPEIFKFAGKIVKVLGEFSYIFLLTPIFGLILGILGLKSTKKIFAILGIILSAIALIIVLVILIFFLFIGLGFALEG